MDKLVEHYGIVLAESTRISLGHAQKIHKASQCMPQRLPKAIVPRSFVLAEMDGTMVPTVRSAADQCDKRKGKSVQWQEAKVSLAYVHASSELVFGATLLGAVEQASKQTEQIAQSR